jgi:hypothetical protein
VEVEVEEEEVVEVVEEVVEEVLVVEEEEGEVEVSVLVEEEEVEVEVGGSALVVEEVVVVEDVVKGFSDNYYKQMYVVISAGDSLLLLKYLNCKKKYIRIKSLKFQSYWGNDRSTGQIAAKFLFHSILFNMNFR